MLISNSIPDHLQENFETVHTYIQQPLTELEKEWINVSEPYWGEGEFQYEEEVELLKTEIPNDEFVAPEGANKRKATGEIRVDTVGTIGLFEKKQRSHSTDSKATENSLNASFFENSLKYGIDDKTPTTGSISPALVFNENNFHSEKMPEKDIEFPQTILGDANEMFNNFKIQTKFKYDNHDTNGVEQNTESLLQIPTENIFSLYEPNFNTHNVPIVIGEELKETYNTDEDDYYNEEEATIKFIKDFKAKVPGVKMAGIDCKVINDPSRIRRYSQTTLYLTPFNWKHAMNKKYADQNFEKKNHPRDSGALKNFTYHTKHADDCKYCEDADPTYVFGPKVTQSKIKICSANNFSMDIFERALSKYNVVYGPNLTTAKTYDPTWVYEFTPTRHGYIPSLSRYPRYPSSDEEWEECYIHKFQEWVKGQVKIPQNKGEVEFSSINWKAILPSSRVIKNEVDAALLDSTNIRERRRMGNNSKFKFIPPQKAILGNDIEVDVDEKECHCPYCPMDYDNPSQNFYHRKKSAYRGHIMNTHGVFDDGSLMKLPESAISVYEYDDKSKSWRNYPCGECTVCGVYIKFTNKNHGLLGYLRHMASHKKQKNLKKNSSLI